MVRRNALRRSPRSPVLSPSSWKSVLLQLLPRQHQCGTQRSRRRRSSRYSRWRCWVHGLSHGRRPALRRMPTVQGLYLTGTAGSRKLPASARARSVSRNRHQLIDGALEPSSLRLRQAARIPTRRGVGTGSSAGSRQRRRRFWEPRAGRPVRAQTSPQGLPPASRPRGS